MIELLTNWMKDLAQDMLDWLKENGEDFIAEMKDLGLDLFEKLLEGVIFVLGLVAPPEVLATSLDVISGGLSPALMYLLSQTGIAEGIQIIGGAIMFRLMRKVATLGMW
jgi:hypothetical protein